MSKYHQPSSSNVDTTLLDTIGTILNDGDVSQLITFLENDNLTKLLHNWSYFASVNDHQKFMDLSVKLSKITHLVNLHTGNGDINDNYDDKRVNPSTTANVQSQIDQQQTVLNQIKLTSLKPSLIIVYKQILTTHIKVVYRALNNNKPSLTNPNLRLLSNILSYDPSMAVEFINSFDLSLNVLPTLLVPPKSASSHGHGHHSTIRSNFIGLWLTLNRQLSHFHRKDLLTNNYKIMNNLWKFLNDDPEVIIQSLVEFITDKILRESNFKKSSKCKILNESVLFKFQLLFKRFDDQPWFMTFLTTLVEDPVHGLTYPNHNFWYNQNHNQFDTPASTAGVMIQINNKSFKINNKLLYTFLTSLKPSESITQLNFVITVLKSNQELIPPYMNWLVQHGGGYHDPSLTSWWIAYSLLYSNILQLSPLGIEQDQQETAYNQKTFNVKLVAEFINLSPLNKSSLTRGLETNKSLITQLSLQLIQFMLLKLELFLGIIHDNKDKQNLIELVSLAIPDISTLNQVYEKSSSPAAVSDNSNKLIKLTSLMIINKYATLSLNQESHGNSMIKLSNNGITQLLSSNLTNNYDLLSLDHYLSIQFSLSSSEFKWWNKINSKLSLFTLLIKMLVINNDTSTSLNLKIKNLLIRLTSNHGLLFNQNLIESPLIALIESLSEIGLDDDSIWNLLDESISRSIRTPYKYVDISHKDYSDLSIFVIVVFEQFRFMIEGNDTNKHKFMFLLQFMKYLIITGESKSMIIKLYHDYIGNDNKELLQVLDFNDIVLSSSESSSSSFLQYINNPSSYLANNLLTLGKKIPTSDLDFGGLLNRLKLTVTGSSANHDQLIVEMMSKLGNYLVSKNSPPKLVDYLISGSYLHDLLITAPDSITPNKLKFGEVFNDVLQKLAIKSNYLNAYCFNNFNTINNDNFQVYLSNFSWLLTNDQILTLQASSIGSSLLSLELGQMALIRMLPTSIQFYHQLKKISHESLLERKQSLLSQLLQLNLIDFQGNIDEEIESILTSESKADYSLLAHLFIANDSTIKHRIIQLISNYNLDDNDELLLIIASSFTKNEFKELDHLFNQATSLALKLLKSNSTHTKWTQLLTIFINGIDCLDKSEILESLFNYIDDNGFKYSVDAKFPQLVALLVGATNQPFITWIHKSILYITKKFAELDSLSTNFNSFLSQFQRNIVNKFDIWQLIPTNILNTQLEVLLNHSSWISHPAYLSYINDIILASRAKKSIDFEKLIQIFINNPHNLLLSSLPSESNGKSRYLSSLIIYNLFNFDINANSKSIHLQDKLISCYLGSIRLEDLIIKEMLVKIESKTMKSWINRVSNWEIIEEMSATDLDIIGGQQDRLILPDGANFVITLNKSFINHTIKATVSSVPVDHKWNESDFDDDNDNSYNSTIYDGEFLLMLIISNEELVIDKEELSKPKFHIKKLIDSNLLQFIVIQLSNPKTVSIAKILLNGILKSLLTSTTSTEEADDDNNFKDLNIYKVYISNILHSLRKEVIIPHVIYYFYANLIPILSNPGHFLYEKSFRYVLSNPYLKSNDIPLYSSIILSKTNDSETENDESYYKQINWLIETFIDGTINTEDLNLIKLRNVIEWLMNLTNSPYISVKLKHLILKFLYIIESIDQGADLLITRFGILTNLNQLLDRINNEEFSKRDDLLKQQLKLNIEQVMLRLGIVGQSSKRIRDWTGDDFLPKYLKRVHS